MKKILYLLIAIPFLFTAYSCNEELDEQWENPNIYEPAPDEVCSGLFTHMQKTRFWMKDYGEWYWLTAEFGSFGEATQLITMEPYSQDYILRWADSEYGDFDKYMSTCNNNTDGQFSRAYTDLNNYMLIQDEVAILKDEAYDNTVIYAKLATVLKDIVALRTVDLFSKIPYFNAFQGTQGKFFAPYDNGLEIYKTVIESYKTIAEELPDIYSKMSEISKNTFATQDIWFKGDIAKWIQLLNGEILRSSVRISGVAEDFVKPYIAAAITNLPEGDFTFASPQVNENRVGSSAGGIQQRGWYEQYYMMSIPDVIMMRMNRGEAKYDVNVDDPRLPVIGMGFSPGGVDDGKNVEYFGVSGNANRNLYLRITLEPDKALPIDSGRKWNVRPQIVEEGGSRSNVLRPQYNMDIMCTSCPWTYYNPITFVLSEMPLTLYTRAEADMFLAEVALKGLASTGKSAAEHISDAVKHSISYWYMLNSVPNYVSDMSDFAKSILTPALPSQSIIDAYANTIKGEFEAAAGVEDKMEILMQQKYIHLNYMHAFEAFAELRRTRHPKLEPITASNSGINLVNQTLMLERFMLPTSERSTNFDEYSKVMADDYWNKPIFWVPDNKKTESYFLPQAIKDMMGLPLGK